MSTTSRAPSSASYLSANSAHSQRSMPTTPTSASSRPGAPSAWPTIGSESEDEGTSDAEEYVLAMHDFSPQQPNITCLSFRAGQVIHVLNRDPSGWWDGELDGRRGWFPSNYVTSEVGLLTEEELPGGKKLRPGHAQNMSVSSTTSWASTSSRKAQPTFARNDHRPSPADSFSQTIDMYCPPLMLPLLKALSLLQNAVRTSRIQHYQPATACIISCVRALLSDIGCLSRDAPVLRQHGVLSQERKRILSDLASLVSQAKRASEETITDETREIEVQAMVRLAGQLFAHVRGFLAVAVQPKSLGDLKVPKRAVIGADYPPMPAGPLRLPQRKLSHQQLASPARRTFSESTPRGHRPAQDSISSDSSSSSFSSDSVGTPATPVFPCGPATTAELTEALRYTHDNYLSTIAAFIGHAHSHSGIRMHRVPGTCTTSRPPTSGCPPAKAEGLRAAKEGLYNVTSTLAESVRLLTAPPADDVSEEAEKEGLLRCATNALKAGSDCVNAVKKCLQRTTGERSFVFNLPAPGDPDGGMYTPRKFGHAHRPSTASTKSTRSARAPRIRKESSLRELHGPYVEGEEEDLTIQAQDAEDADHSMTVTIKRHADDSPLAVVQHPPSPAPEAETEVGVQESMPCTPVTSSPIAVDRALPPVRPSFESVATRSDAMSLNSYAPTEDDRTTWEGSTRHCGPASTMSFEEKLLNGELPTVPGGHAFASAVLPWTFPHDHAPEDVAYNSDGQLVGATLEALVERMTPYDALVEPPSPQSVIARYNILPPPGLSDGDLRLWQQRKGLPVRLRVSNFIKTWVESYWRHSTDAVVIPTLVSFIRDALAAMFPGPSQRILELIHQRVAAGPSSELQTSPKGDRVRDAGIPLNPPTFPGPISEIPRPIMTKNVLSALRSRHYASVALTDFDALELARQLTVMECTLYCAIEPEEMLGAGGNAKEKERGVPVNVNVKAVTSLSTAITGWVAESILNEPDTKKRTVLVKYFIKLADRCVGLSNYSTPRSILAALDSSTIARLHQTWVGLPQKAKVQLESLRKLADHARNYHEYRSRLRNTAPPAVPFLGLYLTDITFCREGNPSLRTSPKAPEKKLLNFNKYHKLARIVQDMQRFQVPYNLKVIPEVQAYLRDAFEKSQRQGDLQDLYRRSLLVEPKQSAEAPPSSDVRQLFAWASRSQQSVSPAPAS
ncbi:ras GEF [Cerioporus squamosus]|nr:ras GEF [Cerioporus squamosus]